MEKLGALAWVLILNVLKIDEDMSLIEQAIKADPNNASELYEQYSYELTNHIVALLFISIISLGISIFLNQASEKQRIGK